MNKISSYWFWLNPPPSVVIPRWDKRIQQLRDTTVKNVASLPMKRPRRPQMLPRSSPVETTSMNHNLSYVQTTSPISMKKKISTGIEGLQVEIPLPGNIRLVTMIMSWCVFAMECDDSAVGLLVLEPCSCPVTRGEQTYKGSSSLHCHTVSPHLVSRVFNPRHTVNHVQGTSDAPDKVITLNMKTLPSKVFVSR